MTKQLFPSCEKHIGTTSPFTQENCFPGFITNGKRDSGARRRGEETTAFVRGKQVGPGITF